MSYKPDNLSVLAYANNFTLWHYVTTDENIQLDSYFNNAADMLRTNDLLIATTATSTQFYIVFSDKKRASISLFTEQKSVQPKYKRVDLGLKRESVPIDYKDGSHREWEIHNAAFNDGWNEAIDDIKSKYGDLFIEIKE